MTPLMLLLSLAIFGFVLWLIVTYIPMPGPIRTAVIAIAVIFLVLWVLSSIGFLGPMTQPIRLR